MHLPLNHHFCNLFIFIIFVVKAVNIVLNISHPLLLSAKDEEALADKGTYVAETLSGSGLKVDGVGEFDELIDIVVKF
jgi:hypothetical protein